MIILYLTILVLGAAVALGLCYRELRRNGVSAVAWEPTVLFSAYFAMVHFVTPLVKYVNHHYRYTSDYSAETLVVVATLTLSAYVLSVGVARLLAFRKRHTYAQPAHVGARACLWVGASLYAAGGLLAWRDLNLIGSQIGLQAFLADAHGFTAERGSLRTFASLMIVGTAVYQAGWHSIPTTDRILRRGTLAIFILMLLFCVRYYDTMSSRNSILLTAIFNIGVFATYGQSALRGGVKQFLLVGILAAVVGGVSYNLTVNRYSLVSNAYFQERLSNVPLYMLDGAFGNDEALLWLVENSHTKYYGSTYVAGLFNLVPRAVWPDKPLGGGPRLINEIRPGSYVPGRSGNNSLTTGMLVEAMMNFSYLGFFIAPMFWAYFSSKLLEYAARSRTRLSQVVMLLASMLFSSLFLYAEFLGFVARIVIVLAFPLGLSLLGVALAQAMEKRRV